MHVRGRDEAVRAHDHLDQHRLPSGLLGGAMEDQHLTGDRVLEPVSCSNHL
jgi:hypothetical protein